MGSQRLYRVKPRPRGAVCLQSLSSTCIVYVLCRVGEGSEDTRKGSDFCMATKEEWQNTAENQRGLTLWLCPKGSEPAASNGKDREGKSKKGRSPHSCLCTWANGSPHLSPNSDTPSLHLEQSLLVSPVFPVETCFTERVQPRALVLSPFSRATKSSASNF